MKITLTKEKKRNLLLDLLLIALILGICGYLEANKYSYSYAISIIERSLVYAVVAVSMNLVNGFTGLFSLGQAGFMALGAYVTAIFTIPAATRASVYYISGISPVIANVEFPIPAALILGGLVAAGCAALIGIPVLRLKSGYLAIGTLGFAEIIRALIAAPQLNQITNGSYGLKSIPGFSSLYEALFLTAVCIGLMVLLINSSYGRMFKAVREDEIAAEAMGINLFRTKELSFVISSFFAGISGGMLAMFMRSIDSKTFQVSLTYDILLIVVIGGIGSVSGSVLGAFLVTGGRGLLRFFGGPLTIGSFNVSLFRSGFRMVIFSILLMVVVLFYRKGLMGTEEFSWNWFFGLFKRKKNKKTEANAK